MATERSVLVRLKLDPKDFIAGARAAGAAVKDLRKDIDTTNDRTAWLAQGFLALGPTLAPLGAVGVGALAGIATQMTFTAVAAGTLTLAFNGVGDALKALNDYQIDPTEAHLRALHKTMAFIGPTGRDLVRVLDEMRNGFIGLGNLSRDNMFPGVIDGLEELGQLAPQVEQIVAKVSATLGDLASDAGEALAGPKFQEFFDFLEADAAPTLDKMARTIGNIADGFGAMLVAFAPLSRDFTGGMLEMSRAFADWAHGLRDNASFQDLIDYIRENTPRVLDLIGQMIETFLQLAEAAAPVGEVMVPALTLFLKLVEAIADSPLGPIFIAAAAAMSLYGRAVALASITTGGLGKQLLKLGFGFEAVTTKAAKGEKAVTTYKVNMARAATGIGVFALAMSPLPEKLGLTNTAMGAMAGSLAGPWGAALGAGVGLLVDLNDNTGRLDVSTEGLTESLNKQTGAVTRNTEKWAANELLKAGAFEAAKQLGVNLDDLTEAALGNEDALKRVNIALEAARRGFYDTDGRVLVGTETLQDYGKASNIVKYAIGDVNTALVDAQDGVLKTGEAMDTTRRKFKKAAEEVDYFGEAVDRVNSKLDSRAALRTYQASLDDLARSVRENGKTLDINTQKGRDNQAALDAIADSALTMAEHLKGVDRDEFLEHAREDFVKSAEKLGLTEKAARDLARQLGLLDVVKASPEIEPKGFEKTRDDIDILSRRLIGLDKMVARPQIFIQTHNENALSRAGQVAGTYADGGYTGPGGKYEPAGIVHRGEFVFDAETTRRNRGFFEAIHKGMAGYYNGGYVAASGQPSAAALPGIDYDRLAAAMLMARQQYGDVHISGDPTVWRKQMEDDARARSTGAMR